MIISTERDQLKVKGQQCQPIHCKRFHSPNDSLMSLNQVPSLPQLKLQAKQFLSQSIHKEIISTPSINSVHIKPLICKNKSCIFLVRNLEDKIAKYILRIKEIVKENNMLRTKLQMERVTLDTYIPSTHRSQKSTDKLGEELSQVRSQIVSIHDSYQFAKFHNETVVTNLTKQVHQVFSNLNYTLSQPILDLNWNKPNLQKSILSNICQKCNSKNNNSQMIELECGHYYHTTCFCEHILQSQNQTNLWCQCKQKISEQQQLSQVYFIILKEMKYINQLALLIQKQESYQMYKCEQNNCPFIILSEFENQISLRSFCQSCLVMRYFYKQETIEK